MLSCHSFFFFFFFGGGGGGGTSNWMSGPQLEPGVIFQRLK